ncbi:MAG: hypothetical protein R3E09_17915 [Novosphingobium sp.]
MKGQLFRHCDKMTESPQIKNEAGSFGLEDAPDHIDPNVKFGRQRGVMKRE